MPPDNELMNELKKELGLVQGVILLTTSLLGTGVFALPELAALAAGDISLWAWPLLIILIFPIAIVFAVLGRHFPHAGGVAHFVGMAFGPRLQRVISWLFLSVIPVSFPAALHIAVGFGRALFGWQSEQLLFGELGTLGLLWFMGSRGASSSANLQAIIAGLIIALIAAILWKGAIKPADITFPAANEITFSRLCTATAIMFWGFVGIEAFTHLSSEFKNPERDFPRALIIGLMLAGSIYWTCTAVVLHFGVYSDKIAATASLPLIIVHLFGIRGVVDSLHYWLSHLLCQPECVCSEFCASDMDANAISARSLSGSTLSRAPSLARVKRYSGLLLREFPGRLRPED